MLTADFPHIKIIFRETNHLVEEFMLLANISVATKIHNDFPDCAVLRRHQQPPLGKFDSLLRAAQLKARTRSHAIFCLAQTFLREFA